MDELRPDELVELQWDNDHIVMKGQVNRSRKSPFPAESSNNTGNEPHIDIAPWINYPIEDPLQNDYCSEFLNEFPEFPMSGLNSLSSLNNTLPSLKSSSEAQDVHDSDRTETMKNQLLQLSQQRAPHSFVASTIKTHQAPSGSSMASRLGKADLGGLSSNLINFSHFQRTFTFDKINPHSHDRFRSKEMESTTNPVGSTHAESSLGLKNTVGFQGPLDKDPMTNEDRRTNEKPIKQFYCQEDAAKDINAASAAYGKHDNEKVCAAVASSVCSGSSTGAASNDPKLREKKRKHAEGDDSGYLSEDVEDESVGMKKSTSSRGSGAKRTRAAEVHNLSERRRRDRINERIHALQQLIPNSNKVDKASMLDEAIEYLKALQLQVQMMSMASGMFMPPMIMHYGMQQLYATTMAHFSPVGTGMGIGMGLGVGYGMGMPFANMHGPQMPCSIPGMAGLHRMAGSPAFQMFGIPGQGVPVTMSPGQIFCGSSSGLAQKTNAVQAHETAPSSSQDKLEKNIKMENMRKTSPTDS